MSAPLLLLVAATALGQQSSQRPQYRAPADRASIPWVVTVVHEIDLQKALAHYRQGQQQQNLRIGVPASVPPFVYNIATGVAVDENGHVVTRLSHLDSSEKGKEIITVKASDDAPLPAQLVGVDYATGFAVLEVPSLKVSLPTTIQLKSLPPGSTVRILSTDVSQKQVGNSRNVRLYLASSFKESEGRILSGGPYATRGALTLLCDDFRLRSDSSVVTDFENRVLGVAQYAGFGRALVFPFSFLRDTVVKRVLEKKSDVPAGWLGIKGDAVASLADTDSQTLGLQNKRGVIVREVIAGSPAESAGIRTDDVIVGVDTVNVATTVDLASLLSSYPADTGVTVRAIREKAPVELKVKLGAKPVTDLVGSVQMYSGIESSPSEEVAALKARLEELKSLYGTYRAASPSSERTDALNEIYLEIRYVQDALRALTPGGPGEPATQLAGVSEPLPSPNSVSPPIPEASASPVRRAQIPLGFWVRELNDQLAGPFGARGMLVDNVIAGSPADAAGLMAGDVIVAVGDRTILGLEQLRAVMAGPNNQFDLKVVRRKEPLLLKISASTSK